MPDPVTTAKSAREALARGLNALQAENLPPGLVELAAPIAQAMGALHQIERSRGTQLLPHADIALNNTRGALSQLQAQSQVHPAVVAATEAVAASLGLVHSLSRLAKQGPGLGPAPATAQSPAQAPAPAPAYGAPQVAPSQSPFRAAEAPPEPIPLQRPRQQPPAYEAPAYPPTNQPFRPGAPAAASAAAPGSPLAATFATDAPTANNPNPVPSGRSGARSNDAAPRSGTMPTVNADLGTHSPTNFYKGLSGNDVVDHGGLFVSTYMIPKIGAPVRLKVSLPGGYEFEANAVVRWSRESSEAGADAPPGFGAQFTAITPEARQLVYRYVRNREPLFHDDM